MITVKLGSLFVDGGDLTLERIATGVKLFDFLYQSFLRGAYVLVSRYVPSLNFSSQSRYALAIVQFFEIYHEGHQVKLQLEHEARDHGRHVIELFITVVEFFVDERVSNLLDFEFMDQFRD